LEIFISKYLFKKSKFRDILAEIFNEIFEIPSFNYFGIFVLLSGKKMGEIFSFCGDYFHFLRGFEYDFLNILKNTNKGTGTFVNALRTSIGRDPIILGKPHKTMWDVLGKVHQLDPARSCMIGDRLDTDIAFAANCSLGFSLAVLSGVSTEEEILQHSNLLNDPNHKENEKAKLVPDYYANSLRDFEIFIRDT
jgi:hypothetical protein